MSADLLTGRTALITGGSSAMGAGIAQALLEKGAKVVLGDLDLKKTEETARTLMKLDDGYQAAAAAMDITKKESIDKAMAFACEKFGKLDILVNNAGVCKGYGLFDLPEASFDLTFAVNVKGLFECCRSFASLLIKRGEGGSIVNIASNAAKVCFEGMADYNASKAAVANLTQSLAKELAGNNINVNAICPGAVDTKMLLDCMETTVAGAGGTVTVEDLRKTWGPPQLGRLIQPYEVGRIAAFLASDAAVIIRGQSISVDGGNTPY